MTEITFRIGEARGAIYWAAAEQFRELEGIPFDLGKMEATEIEKIDNLSITAKILLSAVAGAVIQHLIDTGVETELIFIKGSFMVEKQAET